MSMLVQTIHKTAQGLRWLFSGVVILLLATMMVAVLAQVASRYLFHYPISAASEIATFAQIGLVLFGSGIALSRGQHVAIDIFPAMLPRRYARVALVLISVAIICFLAALCYGALPLIKFGSFQTSPALGLPMKWIYMMMPIAGVYMMVEAIDNCIRRWNDPFPQPLPIVEDEVS